MDTLTCNLHVLAADHLPVLLRTPEDSQVTHYVKLYAGEMIGEASSILDNHQLQTCGNYCYTNDLMEEIGAVVVDSNSGDLELVKLSCC